jgi:hypothetical protein
MFYRPVNQQDAAKNECKQNVIFVRLCGNQHSQIYVGVVTEHPSQAGTGIGTESHRYLLLTCIYAERSLYPERSSIKMATDRCHFVRMRSWYMVMSSTTSLLFGQSQGSLEPRAIPDCNWEFFQSHIYFQLILSLGTCVSNYCFLA